MYPQAYHDAASHLVAFGAWRYRIIGRAKLARALRAMRAVDHRKARHERRHLLFISGMFPAKLTDPRYKDQAWAQPDETR